MPIDNPELGLDVKKEEMRVKTEAAKNVIRDKWKMVQEKGKEIQRKPIQTEEDSKIINAINTIESVNLAVNMMADEVEAVGTLDEDKLNSEMEVSRASVEIIENAI